MRPELIAAGSLFQLRKYRRTLFGLDVMTFSYGGNYYGSKFSLAIRTCIVIAYKIKVLVCMHWQMKTISILRVLQKISPSSFFVSCGIVEILKGKFVQDMLGFAQHCPRAINPAVAIFRINKKTIFESFQTKLISIRYLSLYI